MSKTKVDYAKVMSATFAVACGAASVAAHAASDATNASCPTVGQSAVAPAVVEPAVGYNCWTRTAACSSGCVATGRGRS